MKKIAAILLSVAVSAAGINAQEESSYSISVDFPFVSDYVFRGVKFADESIQPSIELAVSDFYLGMWTNQPVSGNIANEFDFYLGSGVAINESWAVDFGATYYYYPETPSGDEQVEPFIGLAGDLGSGFSGSVYYYYETEFEASTFQADLGYSVSIDDATSFDLAANYGYVTISGGGDYSYYGVSGTLTYALNDTSGIYAGVVYADNDIGLGVEDEHVYFIAGLSVGF
jgi:uncharacterized protein (TIGR02001 family)